MKPDNDNTPRLLSRQEAAGRKNEFVYFVVSEKQNAFKVGFRGSAPRIENLQTGNPDKLTLVREIKGGRDVEAAIHRELSDYRIRGEWFRETQLLDTIRLGRVTRHSSGQPTCPRPRCTTHGSVGKTPLQS